MTAAPGWINSSKQNPCPICSRTKDGDCRINTDGRQVVCHHPKSLTPGEVVNGWAFTGNTSDSRAGHFTIDKPKNSSGPATVLPFLSAGIQASSTSPEPVPITSPIALATCEPVEFEAENRKWRYSPTQGTKREDSASGKVFRPHHQIENKWRLGAGANPWPAYREDDAIKAAGFWVLEAEGEKCADIARAGGRVAISQPGHAHKIEQIVPRYRRLVDAGVLGIVYLQDNDEQGQQRAQQSAEAAAAAGLPLLVLPAADVWPELPEKGSIDDARGTAAERVADLEAAIAEALERNQQAQQIAKGSHTAASELTAAHQQEGETDHREGQRSDPDLTYRELLAAALKAVRQGDDDAEMEARAEIMARFKRTDSAITESLFKLLTEQEGGATTAPAYRSVNLAQVHPIEWLLEGFIPANDLTLLYGQAGAGKTTAALALAFAVVDGTGFLDRDSPATPGRVLFIASDSGVSPLLTALHSIGLADHPANAPGEGQRFFVWAHDADQGALAWDASLRGCLALLQTVKQERIDLVVADSCKAITAKAGLSYTDNGQVAALLTFIKEVICRHCSVVLLNHDGTARGEAAGAKAWKEIPSAVHCIETVLEANEQASGEQRSGIESRDLRRWVVKKCRVPGVAREFRFFLNHDAGQLEPCPEVERVSDCRAAITEVLSQALKNGEPTLARGAIVNRCRDRWGYSQKSVDNSLSQMVAAKHPEVVRAARRGQYRLAPRMVQALSQYTSLSEGKEQGERVVINRVLGTSLQVPEGTQRKLSEFPRENRRNSTNPSQGEGSDQVPSPGAEMGIGNESVSVVDTSTRETTEIRSEAAGPEGQNISAVDHRPTTTTDWVRLALGELGLAPHLAMVSQVMTWLEHNPEQPSCTRSAVIAAMARLHKEDLEDNTAAPWAA